MKKIDISLLISVIILTFFGLFMIYDVSSFVAFRDFEDKYHYIKDQFLWVVLGFGALTFFSIFDYRRLYALALPILLIALILLTLVFIPGIGVSLLGARRWIDAGALIIYFLSGASILHFSLAVPLIGFLGYLLIIVSPYRTKRLDTFLNIDLSSESSYHVKQILIALGSGGLTGVGLGNSLQKY